MLGPVPVHSDTLQGLLELQQPAQIHSSESHATLGGFLMDQIRSRYCALYWTELYV